MAEENRTLEELLNRVHWLRGDLFATVMEREGEEEGHYEVKEGHWEIDEVPAGGSRYGTWESYREEKKWIDKEEVWVSDTRYISVPDIGKRKNAEQQLQQIYDSSEWYSARYAAGKSLNVRPEELDKNINSWLSELGKDIRLPNSRSVKTGEREEDIIITGNWMTGAPSGPCADRRTYMVKDFIEVPIEENVRKIDKARKDSTFLYKLADKRELRQKIGSLLGVSRTEFLYNELVRGGDSLSKEELKELYPFVKGYYRIRAGEKLGYSRLRIWAREYLITTTLKILLLLGIVILWIFASRF